MRTKFLEIAEYLLIVDRLEESREKLVEVSRKHRLSDGGSALHNVQVYRQLRIFIAFLLKLPSPSSTLKTSWKKRMMRVEPTVISENLFFFFFFDSQDLRATSSLVLRRTGSGRLPLDVTKFCGPSLS